MNEYSSIWTKRNVLCVKAVTFAIIVVAIIVSIYGKYGVYNALIIKFIPPLLLFTASILLLKTASNKVIRVSLKLLSILQLANFLILLFLIFVNYNNSLSFIFSISLIVLNVILPIITQYCISLTLPYIENIRMKSWVTLIPLTLSVEISNSIIRIISGNSFDKLYYNFYSINLFKDWMGVTHYEYIFNIVYIVFILSMYILCIVAVWNYIKSEAFAGYRNDNFISDRKKPWLNRCFIVCSLAEIFIVTISTLIINNSYNIY